MKNVRQYFDRLKALAVFPVRLRTKAAAMNPDSDLRTSEESHPICPLAEADGRTKRRSPKFGEYEAFAVDELPPPPNASLRRGISTKHAAEHLGRHPRTLEKWRQSWRRAEQEGKPELRKGPKFLVVEGRIFYTIADLDEYLAAEKAHGRKS